MELKNVPAISVIIPMYNSEKYIGECLDSLLMQTFQNYELIVVNDCSTDDSLKIAESYIEKFDGRLKIYTNEKNSGAAFSRNNGLMLARSEYIYFMDSDDLLLLTALEKMYKAAKEFNADFVNLSGFYEMSADAKEIKAVNFKIERIFTKGTDAPFIDDDLSWRLQKQLTYRYYGSAVLRLFRRDFLIKNKLFFPENVKRCEDVVWKYGILILAKRIVHLPFLLYFYRMSENSLTRQKRSQVQYINSRMTTIIDGIKWIDDIMNRVDFFKENPQQRYAVFDEFMYDMFRRLLPHTLKKKKADVAVYEAVKQGFGEKLGKYNVLVAELCSLIDNQMREMSKIREQMKSD